MRWLGILPWLVFAMLKISEAQAEETIHLNFWEQDPPSVAAEIDKWISVFQKLNPNIKIVRQHYENEELRTKFLRSSVTGEGADIVYGPNDLAGVFVTADVVQAIDTLLEGKQFSPASLSMTKLGGKTWGLPLSEGSHLMLFYRKDQVEQAPADTNSLIKAAKAFSNPKQNKYGLAFFQSEPYWFVAFQEAFGGSPLTRKNGEILVSIDTSATEKALQYLVDLKDREKILPQECNYDCAKNLFLSGKALFHINGDWELNNFREKIGPNLGVAPLPILSETGRPLAPLIGGRFLFLNAATKGARLAAAKKFIDFVTSKLVQLRIAKHLSSIPASLEVRDDPSLKANALLSASLAASTYAVPMPPEVELRAAWDGMRIMVQRALSGQESVAAAVKTGQKAADEGLHAIQKSPSAADETKNKAL